MDMNRVWRALEKASPGLFVCAGVLLIMQVVMIGLRRYEVGTFSDLWIAVPSIPGVIAALIALSGLYARLTNEAPTLARSAAGAVACAGFLLCTAVAWLIWSSMRGGLPQPLPIWFLGVTATFIVAFILAFILSAAASFRAGRRLSAFLLFVPVPAWGSLLVAGAISNMSSALQLDFYTNAVIACAYIALGVSSMRASTSDLPLKNEGRRNVRRPREVVVLSGEKSRTT